jgi:hypothetical protein
MEATASKPEHPLNPRMQVEPTPRKVASRKQQRKVALFVFLPPAILAGSLIANGARQASVRANATALATKALQQAVKDVPFEVRLPAELPQNAVLVRTFLDKPDSDQGFQAYQLNTWYRTIGQPAAGGGRTIHVWQSNDKFLFRKTEDPTNQPGETVKINGQEWKRVTDDRVQAEIVTTYSKRFDDGIIMTVDSKDEQLIEETITAIDIVPV